MSAPQGTQATPRSAPRSDARRRGSGLLILAALAPAAGCEDDMSNQPRYDPLEGSALFGDARSARPPVPGTIHRSEPLDPRLTSGVAAGRLVSELPVPVTRELLVRGQERFTIFCTPCHSPLGDGDGMVVRRGFRRPPSFHDERLRKAPIGHFFEVMTQGFATMPRFAYLLTPHDRWAVAAYIRVLQHSQHATIDEVPAEHRQALERSP